MNLTNSGVSETQPAWSPDGKQIVFRSDRSPSGIYLMDADGQNQKLLAAEAERYSDRPQWSPDDTHILFQSELHDLKTDTYYDEIWVMNADGTNPQNLSVSHAHSDRFGVWSPDSRHIAFSASPIAHSAETTIWVMGADGSNAMALTKSGEQDSSPAWSPDGKQIAYIQRSGSAAGIWKINPDGSGQDYLTPINGDATSLAWSPDGKFLAYVLQGSSVLDRAIYTVDSLEGKQHLVGTDFDNFTWSADSQTLVAESTQFSSLGQLVLIDVQSGKRNTIVSDLICEQSPSWMPGATASG